MPTKMQLFTPAEIKEAAALDKGVYDEDIITAAKWVQDESIERVLGSPLFNRVVDLVSSGAIDAPANRPYKSLLYDYLLYIVGWGVRADIQPLLHNKVRNAGTVRSTDEHIQSVDQEDLYRNINRFEKRRDAYVKKTEDFLRRNASDFPEYAPCDNSCEGAPRSQWPFGIYVDK